ncbi:hypothetical protein BDD12DRAFT_797171 [Trichophaea hybrida]|nr:hypothetical protein BDD12DRAFT_797171 [Trichophaea hybrida]
MDSLIADAHAKCFLSFLELISAIENPVRDFQDQAPLKDVLEEFGKYKLWAGNVGAAHSGKRYQISLDYRLREASFYKTQVPVSVVQGKRNPFEELSSSCYGSQSEPATPPENDSDEQDEADDSPLEISSSSGDEDQPDSRHRPKLQITEMPQLVKSIKFTITCLYKMPIRQPAPLDRLEEKPSVKASFYQHFNVLYVKDKFPKLDPKVATRLGKMISRRRELHFYRISHAGSLQTAKVEPKSGMAAPLNVEPLPPAKSDSGPEATRGVAVSEISRIAESKTSMASSYACGNLRVELPPRPKGKDGKELDRFECPYCLVIQCIKTDHSWKKHVLGDLQRYACTYPDCDLLEHFFDSQEEWYKHGTQQHRLERFCNIEGHPQFTEESDFLAHMDSTHNTTFKTGQLSLLLSMFQRPSRSLGGTCNFCLKHSAKLKSLVFRHLEQVALPRVNEAADGETAELNSHFSEQNADGSADQNHHLQDWSRGYKSTLQSDQSHPSLS